MPSGIVFRTAKGKYSYTRSEPGLLESDWYGDALEADGRAVFISRESREGDMDPIPYPEGTHVFSVARLINDPDTREPLAVICADADTGIFRDLLASLDFTVPAAVFISDKRGNLVYAGGESGLKDLDFTVSDGSGGTVIAEGRRYARVTAKIDLSGWVITILIARSDLYKRVLWYLRISFFVCCFGACHGGIRLSPFDEDHPRSASDGNLGYASCGKRVIFRPERESPNMPAGNWRIWRFLSIK